MPDETDSQRTEPISSEATNSIGQETMRRVFAANAPGVTNPADVSPEGAVVRVDLPAAHLPDRTGLLIRKPARTDAITRVDEIRYCRRFAEILPAPPAR